MRETLGDPSARSEVEIMTAIVTSPVCEAVSLIQGVF
jgi:hypothetical protein